MKQKTTKDQQYTTILMIFLGALGVGFEIVRNALSDKHHSTIIWPMLCILVAGIASKQRKKYSKS
jgi:hypothetical protein